MLDRGWDSLRVLRAHENQIIERGMAVPLEYYPVLAPKVFESERRKTCQLVVARHDDKER